MSQVNYLDLEESVSNVSEWICGQLVPRSSLDVTGHWIELDTGRAMPNGEHKFDVFSNVRVHSVETGDFLYPNVVVCQKDASYNSELRQPFLSTPLVIVQIVSDDNFNLVHENKLTSYLSIPSVQHCLLISQEKIFVHRYARYEKGWLAQCYTKKDDNIELEILGSSLPLEKIYRHFDASNNDTL